MLTAEGIKYADDVASSYSKEAEQLQIHLKQEKHTIPYDVVSLHLRRYTEESPRRKKEPKREKSIGDRRLMQELPVFAAKRWSLQLI